MIDMGPAGSLDFKMLATVLGSRVALEGIED